MDGVILMRDKKNISLNKFTIFIIIFGCNGLRWVETVISSIIDGYGVYLKQTI